MFNRSSSNHTNWDQTGAPRFPGVVLMYHRVNTIKPDPWTLAVSPAHFAEHLKVLTELMSVVSLNQLIKELQTARARRLGDARGKFFAAITFYDGYADNFEFARPSLNEFRIPATVFVTAGRIGSTREFWWDELDRIFLQSNVLPAKLSINIAGRQFERTLDRAVRYSPADFAHNQNWNCIFADLEPHQVRQRVYLELFNLIRPLDAKEQDKTLAQLFCWAAGSASQSDHNVDFPVARSERRMMSADELRRMAASDLIEIGAHTMTHPVLSQLSAEEQQEQISASKQTLEKIICRRVAGFAYPNGFRVDYTRQTIAAVQNAGFDYACAAFDEPLTLASDLFQLPRLMVRDWDGSTFTDNLARVVFNP